jgi:predicted peptidase
MSRLKNGYGNSNSWLSRYVNDINEVENNLAGFNVAGAAKPTEFKSEFIDIFSKVTMPTLKSDYVMPGTLEGSLGYGSFTWQSFKASNGVKIDYLLYLPDQVPEGLPVMVYMHGGSSHGNGTGGMTSHGLTKFLNNKSITPQGIVICPHIRNFEGDNIQVGLRELAESVANQYNADKDRICASGHSYGAITAYRMVNANPGFFSCIVPISGYDKVTDAFNDVSVWAFHGDRDLGNGQCNYNRALTAVHQIANMGSRALMHTFQGSGHGWVQDYTYSDEYDSPDGQHESVLSWAFRQRRGQNKA